LAVPCVDAPFEWRRVGKVTTLGQLFMALGKKWTAAAIYEYYLRLRLVGLKRHKGGAPGQSIGMAASENAGAALRQGMQPWRKRIVEEYCAIQHEDMPVSRASRQTLTDEAVRHLHALLLQDLRPPWMTDDFPQALPGCSTLSRYSRPCFLQWDAAVASMAFGPDVMAVFEKKAEVVNLKLYGVVARPLYACTAKPDGTPCLQVASMSPLLEFPEERKEWRCASCRRNIAPVTDSVPERFLRLYPLVVTSKNRATPMRCPPMNALVFVPPLEFSWSGSSVDVGYQAMPVKMKKGNRVTFQYSESESRAIWLSANSFTGEEEHDPY